VYEEHHVPVLSNKTFTYKMTAAPINAGKHEHYVEIGHF
jgi:hypothetical protein